MSQFVYLLNEFWGEVGTICTQGSQLIDRGNHLVTIIRVNNYINNLNIRI